MLRVSHYTLGCKLNQSESETALAELAQRGYEIVDWRHGADMYILNTCTVTSRSEQKARRLLRHLENLYPQAVIVVCGCYAVVDANTLAALGRRVAVVSRPQNLLEQLPYEALSSTDEVLFILNRRQNKFAETLVAADNDFPFSLPKQPLRHRYFFKIQDGCNRTCSFCRIRIARGRSRSLQQNDIITRLQEVAAAGYQEVVLTGVHINSYEDHENHLGELLLAILEETQGFRIRLSSLEPAQLSASLEQALAHPRICPHFHLSLQSGSAHVLRQMRRAYAPALIERYAEQLRSLQNDPFFSADVIVGFPGESEKDFQETCQLLERIDLAACHVFSYSSRPQTDAAMMKKQLPATVKNERLHHLKTLMEKQYQNYLQRQHNRWVDLLLESQEEGVWTGSTENYLRLELADNEQQYSHGQLVSMQLKIEAGELLHA